MDDTAVIPTIVVGGYLGAGKTTLVNHVLRHSGRRIAVLVNDFGEINIDADLIEGVNGNVMNIAGGCVCCSFGNDMVGALLEIPERTPPPEFVLIEASGVALPGMVAGAARLAKGIDVEGVVTLVDAETIRVRASNEYVGDAVLQQLRDADLLIVNKADLVTPDALAELRHWLSDQAPQARQIVATNGAVSCDALLGPGLGRTNNSTVTGKHHDEVEDHGGHSHHEEHRHHPDATDMFVSGSWTFSGSIDTRALATALANDSTGVVRAKGFVVDHAGSLQAIQVVGQRWRVGDAPVRRPSASGRIVWIGLRGACDPGTINTIMQEHDHKAKGL
jgi:G3E family GTPase